MMKRRTDGFTLTELMFATAFLAFMLLFIVSAMLQYMATYNKGLTYKAINQTGRTLFEDVTRSMRVSEATIRYMDEGRLCVGGQAYIWNTSGTNNRYEDSGELINGIIRVPDGTQELCKTGGGGNLPRVSESDQTIVATDRVAVQKFSAQSADNGRLYTLSLKLSTSGVDAPVLRGGKIECPPGREGQFCAMASFETQIAARR